jgi:hypothetical protein
MWIKYLLKVYILYVCTKRIDSVEPNAIVTVIEQPTPVQQTKSQGCRRNEKHPDDKEFRIAWLAPEQEFHNLSAATSAGAVKLALVYIRQNELLKGYRLKYVLLILVIFFLFYWGEKKLRDFVKDHRPKRPSLVL